MVVPNEPKRTAGWTVYTSIIGGIVLSFGMVLQFSDVWQAIGWVTPSQFKGHIAEPVHHGALTKEEIVGRLEDVSKAVDAVARDTQCLRLESNINSYKQTLAEAQSSPPAVREAITDQLRRAERRYESLRCLDE